MNLKLYQIFKRHPITHSNQGQAPHQLFARLLTKNKLQSFLHYNELIKLRINLQSKDKL